MTFSRCCVHSNALAGGLVLIVSLLNGCPGGGGTENRTGMQAPLPSNQGSGYACIEQVGRGQGDLLTGDTP